MGRRSTGSMTTNVACRIELSYLLKKGYIVKGRRLNRILGWTNGSNISIETNYTDEKYIWLRYTNTNISTNEKTDYDYKIYLHEAPSNLGKGNVLYFICPSDGHYCRILYKCYGSPIWKSRLAYRNRIYYLSQVGSKLDRFNDRFWQIDGKLKTLQEKAVKSQYKGKKTRLIQRIEWLENRQNYFDEMRWTILQKSVQKIFHH
jgi:hypothetical protein